LKHTFRDTELSIGGRTIYVEIGDQRTLPRATQKAYNRRMNPGGAGDTKISGIYGVLTAFA